MAFCGGDVYLCTIHGGCTGAYEYGADDGFLWPDCGYDGCRFWLFSFLANFVLYREKEIGDDFRNIR